MSIELKFWKIVT